jgi:N-acetylneuraminate synthase
MPVEIIAEVGINHNGDINVAKKLIAYASLIGCDYVKFQKRTPDLCVPEAQKFKIKETPWGNMTYLDYKKRVEFGANEYGEINDYCKNNKIKWFASVWDIPSVDFMCNYTNIGKIPSALITNQSLIEHARKKFDTLIISTGMSTEDKIELSVLQCNPDIIMHTNSSYPSPIEDLNLAYIRHLKDKYPNKKIGYSGHEFGLVTTFAAVAIGAEIVERHVTLDRTMWGSDQMVSVEPHGLMKLVNGIRNIEKSIGSSRDRKVFQSEMSKMESLRGL